MARPRLLNPVPVVYEPISRSQTPMDARAREPVHAAARETPLELLGQVSYDMASELEVDRTGALEDARGYIVHRWEDLDALGWRPERGDRIARIGEPAVWERQRGLYADRQAGLYVLVLRDGGHYADRGGPTLVKVFFADRRPQTANPH
jgi:hypothetical protein